MKYSLIALFLLVPIVFLSPLEMYRINVLFTAISISRFLIIIAYIFIVFGLLINSFKFYRTHINSFLFFYLLIPLILTMPRLHNYEFLVIVLSAGVIFAITHSIKSFNSHLILLRAFQFSYIWFIFFALYTYIFFFKTGSPVTDIPFREFLPFTMPEAGHIKKGFIVGGAGQMALPRLSLPLGTPPVTSMALVMGILVFLADNTLSLSKFGGCFRWIMSFLLILCLFATMSKTGIVVLFFSMTFFVYFKVIKRGKINKNALRYSLFIFFFLILMAVFLPVDNVVHRLFNPEVMSGTIKEHFNTRIEGIRIFSQNLKHFFGGVGLGNYYLFGKGTQSHSSYTTILAEIGILGSFSVWLVYIYTAIMIHKCYEKAKKQNFYKTIFPENLILCYLIGTLCILIGALAYEIISLWPVFVFLGLTNNAIVVIQREISVGSSALMPQTTE